VAGRVLTLGTGAAEMIPAFNCHCRVCEEARRRPELRRRCACTLVEIDGYKLLIDVGSPEAVAEAGGEDIDLVLLSHEHVDHLAGLNLLKWSATKIKVLCSAEALNSYYIWPLASKRVETLEFQAVEAFKPVREPLSILPIRLNHSVPTLGYIIENTVAYLLDTIGVPEESLKALREVGVQVALVDTTYGLGEKPVNHNNLRLALDIVERVEPKLAILTHIAHHAGSYEELRAAIEGRGGVEVSLDRAAYSFA